MNPMAKYPVTILCVDDELTNTDLIKRHLAACVDEIIVAADGQQGHELFLKHIPDVVLTDLMMPYVDGLKMSRMIRSVAPKVPIILMTSCSSIDFLPEAIDIGITQFLPKPLLKNKLLTAVQRCYETVELERRLLNAQKLESLGVLAGGVAHNFNNILTAIIGNTDLALNLLPPDSPVKEYLKIIENSAFRAAGIAKQMMDCAGKGGFKIDPININLMLDGMREMLQFTVPEGVAVCFMLDGQLPYIKADSEQMRQIVTNLVINAVEAMENREGSITISTGTMECDHAYLLDCWYDTGVEAGRYVFLEIADTGCGMDREIIAKLFDPFFSTKFIGRGLGMAAVFGIVRSHKGAIHITSTPGAGSTFRILFPACLAGGGHD
ncbi:MAG: response regulator [Deltaproteobacteria bacterium]